MLNFIYFPLSYFIKTLQSSSTGLKGSNTGGGLAHWIQVSDCYCLGLTCSHRIGGNGKTLLTIHERG